MFDQYQARFYSRLHNTARIVLLCVLTTQSAAAPNLAVPCEDCFSNKTNASHFVPILNFDKRMLFDDLYAYSRQNIDAWSSQEARNSQHSAANLSPHWRINDSILLATLSSLIALVLYQQRRDYQRLLEVSITRRSGHLFRIIDQLCATNRALVQENQTDTLTGLHNRRFLHDQIVPVLAELKERNTANMQDIGFLLLDLDNFKRVNDTYGHAAGDRVLVQFSQLLQRVNNASDYLMRWGGEEFLVVLRQTDAIQAKEIAERIRTEVMQQVFDLGDGITMKLTCSIGVTLHPQSSPNSWTKALEMADLALYCAKQNGRNRCAMSTAQFQAASFTPVMRLVAAK